MQRTNLYLEPRQTAALDEIARAEGISRAEVVRRLIDRSLSQAPDDLANGLEAIESSFGVLSGAAIPVRGPDERSDHLERIRTR